MLLTIGIIYQINTVLCPIKVMSNTIERIAHTSCYCIQTYSETRSGV